MLHQTSKTKQKYKMVQYFKKKLYSEYVICLTKNRNLQKKFVDNPWSFMCFAFLSYGFLKDSRHPRQFKKCNQEKRSDVLPENKQYYFCLSGNYSSDVICITFCLTVHKNKSTGQILYYKQSISRDYVKHIR